MPTPKPDEAAAELKDKFAMRPDAAEAIRAALEAQREAPASTAKPLSQSMTVRAAVANAIMPILALKIAQWSGVPEEQAWEIAATVFALLSSLVAIGMRRAWGTV